MQTAREIADARLAKGEISIDQHRIIISNLDASERGPPPLPPGPTTRHSTTVPSEPRPLDSMPPLPQTSQSTHGRKAVWPWVVAGGIAGIIGLGLLVALLSADGLAIGNIRAVGKELTFKLSNSSSTRADALIWVEQSGFSQCERVMFMQADQTYDVTMTCPTLEQGKFILRSMWAEFDSDKARVATRIPSRN